MKNFICSDFELFKRTHLGSPLGGFTKSSVNCFPSPLMPQTRLDPLHSSLPPGERQGVCLQAFPPDPESASKGTTSETKVPAGLSHSFTQANRARNGHIPIISATQETEARTWQVQNQPGQNKAQSQRAGEWQTTTMEMKSRNTITKKCQVMTRTYTHMGMCPNNVFINTSSFL